MGTRSLTKVIDSWENEKGEKHSKTITCMYRQYDGYMEGHGHDLAEWLSKYTIVNGIGLDEKRLIANGMTCLAAQMYVHFKSNGCKEDGTPVSTPGNFYCYPPDSQDCGEEYIYEIEKNKNQLKITVYDVWDKKEIFHGTPQELLEQIEVEA